MSDKHAVFRLAKIKEFGALQRTYIHNFRKVAVPNADPAKEYLNKELVNQTAMDYNELWKYRAGQIKMKTGKDIRRRKDNVIAFEVVTSFTRGADVDVEKWAKDNVKWLKQTFGEDNVLSANLHMDEGTPHIHSIIQPVNQEGFLSAKQFTGGRSKMISLQTSYGKAMKEYGLKRGLEHSLAEHQDIKRFYAAVNNALEVELPEPDISDTLSGYREKIKTAFQEVKLSALKKECAMRRELDVWKTKFYNLLRKYKKAIILYDSWENQYGVETTEQKFDELLNQEDTQIYNKNYEEIKES